MRTRDKGLTLRVGPGAESRPGLAPGVPAMRRVCCLTLSALTCLLAAAGGPDGNRLAYLAENDPYYPGPGSAKLTTPQWVGEPGVEAVVVLAIDDLRDPPKYEAYLRPILDRLKAIDGRAAVSIMTCRVNPGDPQVKAWIEEGVNLDVHTVTHPCPLLQKGDFPAARDTVHDCLDLLHKVEGNRPVAFRVPCCDSLNTPSPRFFSEIFNATSPGGHHLTIDSSVFNILTADDPALPREIVNDPNGGERFRKYLPFRSFVNTIENHPYPYVINRLCWEFPCVVPSDWEAQNLQKPFNPKTVEDLKAALDAVVLKQGVFNLVFHPHGWIRAEQVVELIDHAVARHGKKVKFLNFREAQERLDRNLLAGTPLRDENGGDNGVRVVDLNNDGYVDVLAGPAGRRETRIWEPEANRWKTVPLPAPLAATTTAPAFGVLRPDGHASAGLMEGGALRFWDFDGDRWVAPPREPPEPPGDVARLRDLDGDGICELILSGGRGASVHRLRPDGSGWERLPFGLPEGVAFPTPPDLPGPRFVDVDEDGRDDLVFSDDDQYGLYLFDSMEAGWSRKVTAGKAGEAEALPKLVRGGTDNGFWVHSRHLWWQNEDTATLPDLVDRRSFNDLLKNVEPRGKTPSAALRSVQVRPGFKVELAAAEPLVRDPIAFDWSADGRLWVVEMGDYPLGADGKGSTGGRVRVLTDDDGDGRYDRSTLFLDGLGFPTGVTPWRKGVLIACAPDILYAEDRDGDGRADRREVLFTGFRPGNPQHRMNGFELGLDGWLYGANGDSGGVVRSAGTGKAVDIRGRDFRFDPDTGAFETEAGVTQYGRRRDDWGRWFGNNNPNWGWVFMLDESDLRRNRSFAAPDPRKTLEPDTRLHPVSPTAPRFNDLWAAGRVTSANSPTPYRDDLFGPEFAESLFVSDPVHNLVHRMDLEPDGPGLKGARAPGEADREFLASSDPWFRPTQMKTGPDGALWVADMGRAVIEHPEWIPDDWEKRIDLRAGHDLGRIFRVVPVGRSPRAISRLDTLDTAGLVAALDGPNGWRRDTAQRLLRERRDPSAVGPLRRLAATTGRPKVRVQALWVLENLGALTAEDVSPLLDDPEPQARRSAVGLAGRLFPGAPELVRGVARLSEDPDAAVRFKVALTLGLTDDPAAGRALAAIARRDGADPWFRAAVLCSAPKHVGALLAGLFGPGVTPPEGLVRPLFALAGSPAGRAGLTDLLGTLGRPAGAGGRYAPWQFSALAGLSEAARGAGRPLDRLAGDDADARAALERLAPLYPAARALAADPDAPEPDRITALGVFGRDPAQAADEREVVAGLLRPQVSAVLQREAVEAAARGRDPRLPDTLLGRWNTLAPGLRSAVLDALLSREEWTGALLSSLEDTCTPAGSVDPAHRRALLEHPNRDHRERAAAVFGPAATSRGPVVARYRDALKSPGDPAAGGAVFRRLCATCHRLGGVGSGVGPDLAALNDRSPEAILTAVLDPNRAVESKYSTFNIALTDGRVLSGVVASESAASLTLRRAEGKEDVVPRSEIEAMTGTGQSLMPEGMEKDLSDTEMADLVAYLNDQGPPPKALEGNAPRVVTADAGGVLVLPASAAEVRGGTLVFETRYGNLGYWSSPDDRATWRFEAPRAGRYEVWVVAACDPSSAGQTLRIAAGGATLDHKVGGTGSWDHYTTVKAGELTLDAGPGRLDAFAAAPPRGPLIDLRALELRPLPSDPCCGNEPH